MILSPAKTATASAADFQLNGFSVEIVDRFKLLGCTIDNKLDFKHHYNNLKKNVLFKLYSIKNIFFLSDSIRLHFFKTFLLPHFDYCASLFVYFSLTLLNKINKLYNLCLFKLLKISVNNLTESEALSRLKPLNLLPFKCRLFYRFSLFSFKLLNNQILPNIFCKFEVICSSYNLRESSKNLVGLPFSRTMTGAKRLSYSIPIFVNKIIRSSFNLCLKDFKSFIMQNFLIIFNKFYQAFF